MMLEETDSTRRPKVDGKLEGTLVTLPFSFSFSWTGESGEESFTTVTSTE